MYVLSRFPTHSVHRLTYIPQVDAPKEQMSLWSTSRYIQNAVAPHTFHSLTLHATSGLVEALATGRSVRARHIRSLVLKSATDENLEATVCNALSSLQELREVRYVIHIIILLIVSLTC